MILHLPSTAIRRTAEEYSAFWNQRPREFGRHSSELRYSSAFSWERANSKDRQSAFARLAETTDILKRASQYTPLVKRAVDQLSLEHSFVDETRGRTPQSQLLTSAAAMPRSGLVPFQHGAASTRKHLHTRSEARQAWAASLVAVSEAVPGAGNISEDAQVLLLILSFLSTSDRVPLDLFNGAMLRKRWNVQGEIVEVDAVHAGLAAELCSFLSDTSRIRDTLHELSLSSAVSQNQDQTYTLNEAVVGPIRTKLGVEELSFWRRQALVLTYRGISWKYLEPSTPNTQLVLPHLKHVLQAFQDCYESLPTSIRTDLVLTLVEASRFPNMAWKRFAVGQAEIAARGLEDPYLSCCIAQSQSLLSRIGGNMDHATSSIGHFIQGRVENSMDNRMNSAIGHVTIQRSLNCIQAEDLSAARNLLEDWKPLQQEPSPIEQVVVFRKEMLLGKILRFQGAFSESLIRLKTARKILEHCKYLIFDEDLRDLTCDHGDTLRELGDSAAAESHLRAEITRRDQRSISFGKSLLELALAEALFAQGRFREAEKLCLDVQSRPSLLKLERLRSYITMAKIRHVESDNEGAFSYWSEALKEIAKFQLNNGRTTRIIVISICDALSGLGQAWLLTESQKQVAYLDEMAKPGGVQWWIAGMRHWLEYLQKPGFHSRL